MPTTYANSINSNPIYAARAEMDASGNVITTTYATKAEIPSDELPAKSASDAGKALVVNSAGTGVEWSSVGGGGNIFMATSTTTFTELWQAFHVEKKMVYCAAESKPSSLTPYFLQTLKSSNTSNTTGSATFVQFNKNITGSLDVSHATVWFNSASSTLGIVTFNIQTIVPANPGSHVGEFLSASSNGNMVFASVNQVPSSTSSDEDKVLTVNSSGTPVWATPSGGSVSVSSPLSGDGSVGSPITLDYDTSCLSLKTTQAGPGAWFNPITTYSYCGLSSDVISALSTGTVYFRFTNLVSAENLDSPNESTGGYYHYISACPCLVPYDDVMGQFDATAAIYPWDSSTEDVFDTETGECSSWSCSLSNISLDSRLWYLVVAPQPYLSDDYGIHPNIGETAYGDAQIAYQVAASAELTVSNPVPSATASDASKVLGVTATDGTLGWVAQPTLASLNSAGITDLVSTAALPASPVATVLYLIPEA